MLRRCLLLAVCLVLVPGGAGPLRAENWPQWRGPRFTGSSPEKRLPKTFAPDQNVAWTVELPGNDSSTPIVWENRVFLSAQDQEENTWALCLSAVDSSVLWRHRVGKGFTNKQGNTAASPSPVTDGRRVWFLFGTGDLAAYDVEGQELWRRNLQEDHGQWEILWNYAASPLLYDGKLYIPVIQGHHRSGTPEQAESYLLCVDPATGADLWKHMRPSDAAYEAKQAYTTPVPMEQEDGAQILLAGGDYLSAHSPADGKELWRSPNYNPREVKAFRTVASPVTTEGMVLVSAPRGRCLYALKPGTQKWAWTRDRVSPDVPTPLAYRGRFYVLDDKEKTLRVVDPASGRLLAECALGGRESYRASPTAADGKIYCMNMGGEVAVIAAGEQPEVLHRASFGGQRCGASIAISGGRLFIRAGGTLYCVGR